MDSSGDIVRVDGVNFAPYHNPPECHLKILAQHIRQLPSGEAPIIGKVLEVVKTVVPYNGKLVKALAAYIVWARDGAGELLPLAKHYKDLYDGTFIDQMSVGIMVDEARPLDTGGIEITACTIFESSLVTIPDNASATVIKEIKEKLGDLLEEEKNQDEPEEKSVADQPTEEPKPEEKNADDEQEKVAAQLQAMLQAMSATLQCVDENLRTYGDRMNSMLDRLDTLESAVIVMADRKDRDDEDDDVEEKAKALTDLSTRADRLLKFLSN